MSLVLVIDDVKALCEQYAYDLKRLGGFDTMTATGGREALDTLDREPVDCMVLDLEMPVMDGFGVLRALAERKSTVPVIVYTSTGDYERCVQAVKLGAHSFIDKAEPMERVVREVENALEKNRLSNEVKTLRRRLDSDTRLVGASRAMDMLREAIGKLAPIPSPVLITGESGTGKELVARELHRLSGRSGAFFAINSAALPENLVEAELFGHEKGAFTGADRLRKGAFETAAGGTLFLDEIGEVAPAVQAKLLRVLENGEISRVGGNRSISVDARVVAATNRNLEAEVAAGRFREDLYYRLNVHMIQVPPLRERLSDVPVLAGHFIEATCRKFGVRGKTLGEDAAEVLKKHPWSRNNVRELRNIVERMILAAEGPVIEARHVPAVTPAAGSGAVVIGTEPGSLKDLKADAERRILLAALDRNDWHISNTARELDLADHSSLLKIMRRHGLRRS